MLSSSSNDDNSDCLLKEREKVFHGWHFYFIFFLDVPCKAFIIGIIFSLKVISDTKLSSGLFLLVHWTAVLPEKKEKIIYQSKTSGEPLCSLTNRKSLTVSSWSSDFSFFQFGELHWYILQEYLLGLFFFNVSFVCCLDAWRVLQTHLHWWQPHHRQTFFLPLWLDWSSFECHNGQKLALLIRSKVLIFAGAEVVISSGKRLKGWRACPSCSLLNCADVCIYSPFHISVTPLCWNN